MTTKTAQGARKPTMETAKTVEHAAEASADAMKEQMDRTIGAFRDMGGFGKENFEALVASATACSKGMETLSARAAAYSKQAMENHVAAAKAMMTARSVQELMERQSEYARASFDTYVAEMNQVSDLVAGLARDALQPFTDRVSAMGQIVQSSMPGRAR